MFSFHDYRIYFRDLMATAIIDLHRRVEHLERLLLMRFSLADPSDCLPTMLGLCHHCGAGPRLQCRRPANVG